ncbi:oligosaccharide flippase family protein [Streptomonospora sp. S1-112]|uniref:Oligosaccharide flippase family protein n=2 Tax=Streptomonospora mangrovi TaxID=2883123 RepID=A0A9X3SGQ7_9ACTN|nr:oligosaccharide flippase family protein [Streptomonospora mangrovi]MDA0564434.1 oligosaccharide flippase family protein [Streptomonospora mangrovi]
MRRVARGGVVNMAGAVTAAVVNLGVVVAVTRGFSAETAGLLFSATSVFLVASAAANLGTTSGLVYFLARLRTAGAAAAVPRVLRTALAPATGAAVLLGALLFAFAGELAELLSDPAAGVYLRLLAVFLPFAVITDAALAATRAYHDHAPTVLLEKLGRPLAQLALVCGVAVTGWAGLLAVAWAGPYLPVAVLAWWWMRRITGAPRAKAPPCTPRRAPAPEPAVSPRAFWAFALPRSVAGIAQLGIQRLGIVFVAALQGAAEAALFTAATRFMVAGQFAAQALQFAAEARLAELLAVDDRAGANRLYRAGTAWQICLTWPMFLPALAYAPLLMALFGSGYTAGAPVLVVIALAQLASAALGMGDLVLTMTGRTRWNLVNNVLALAADLVLCAVLIPVLGTVGAALAWAAAITVRKVLPLAQLLRSHGLHPFDRRWFIAAGVCLGWFGALPALCAALLGTTGLSLAAALAMGTAGYLATLWRLRGPLELDGLVSRRRRARAPEAVEAGAG